ncbi:MAG: glycosyltransferase [Thermoguttaceae bacterium]|jgi:MGT family glycosyltransferase
MAHYALVCPEYAGHLLSMGAVGNELVRRGHRVTLVAGEEAAPIARQLDLPLHLMNLDEVPRRNSHLMLLAFGMCGAGWRIALRDLLRWRAEAVLRLVPPALRELAVDGVIVDQTLPAGGTAAEHLGLPFVTVCSALMWKEESHVPPPFTGWGYAEDRRALRRNRLGYASWRWFIRPVLGVVNRYRKAWNLRPLASIDESYSPLATLSQLCPEFDFPQRQLPETFHYIGSLANARQVRDDHQFPWERLDGRPLVFASLGTVPYRSNVPVFRKILAACAGLDAQLVLALGKWSDEEDEKYSVRQRLGPIPGNPLVVDFAPQLALLDRAALLITHAGINTVVEAASRGVPMIALPRSDDQPGMGARIELAGVGLRASFRRCTPRELRGLIQRVLTEPAFRQRARQLQQAMLAAGGMQRAAEIAEEALETRRPVPRCSCRAAVRVTPLPRRPIE